MFPLHFWMQVCISRVASEIEQIRIVCIKGRLVCDTKLQDKECNRGRPPIAAYIKFHNMASFCFR